RPRLRPKQWNARRRCRRFVLAERDPCSTEPRIAQPDAAEDRDQQQPERGPEHQADEVHVRALLAEIAQRQAEITRQPMAETGRADRVDPGRTARQVEAQPVLLAVPRDLGQDLGATERDDREVDPPW